MARPRPTPATPALPKPGQVATHLLPPLLRRLVRSLGEAAAYRLVEHHGGTYVVVPNHVQPEHVSTHPVCLLIGPQAWAALVNDFGPATLQLPKVDSLLRQVRHERVRHLGAEARATGRPLKGVALATGYSLRQVHNILGIDPPEGAQGDLFGDLADDPDEAEVHTPAAPAAAAAAPEAVEVPQAHNPFGLGRT